MNRRAWLFLLLVATWSCDGPFGPSRPAVDRVEVAPENAALEIGDSVRLTATPRTEDGAALLDKTIAWTSSDPAVASVTSQGSVHAIKAGQATILASVEGKSAETAVMVLTRVQIWPDTNLLLVGMERRLSFQTTAEATELPATNWVSSDPSVVSVNDAGNIVAIGPGSATISSVADGRTRQASVRVIDYGAALRFMKVGRGDEYACGLTAEGTVYCWGWDRSGILGTDEPADRCSVVGLKVRCARVPVRVRTDVSFVDLTVGDYHACGLTSSGLQRLAFRHELAKRPAFLSQSVAVGNRGAGETLPLPEVTRTLMI